MPEPAPPQNPLVSIIVIFLNEKRFLAEAIESVLAQTSPAWELLLVDDGSTDGSSEIAKGYAARDPRIVYLEHPGHENRGKSTSRNLGIRVARGEYLVFLDGDDVLLPGKVERQGALLRESGADMVYGPTLYWNRWPGAPPDSAPDRLGKLGVTTNRAYAPPTLLTKFLRDGGIVPCICGLTVRRSLALEIGGFDERIQNLYEDQVFLAKVCAQATVFVEDGCWDQYRQHPNSTSRLAVAAGEYHPRRHNNPSRLMFLDWLKSHLAERGIHDRALNRALKQAYRPFQYPRLYHWIYSAQIAALGVKKRLAKRWKRALGRA